MKNKPYDLYELPPVHDIKDMLLQKAEKNPDGIAFTYSKGSRRISKTYHEFRKDVNALGMWLYKRGLQGKHIAVIGENSYEWLLCFFAIACGGSTAVPVDKELPAEEMKVLLQKADVQAVFYSKWYHEPVENAVKMMRQAAEAASGADVIAAYSMSGMEEFIAEGEMLSMQGQSRFTNYQPDGKELCCIMFTSGTTGSSKGVMLSHENIAEDINGSCRLFEPKGQTIAVLPFHHAFGLIVAVLMVFNYGYEVCINKSLKTIQKDMQAAKPQTMFLVPLFVETFHRQIWASAKKEGRDRLLRRMMRLSDVLLALGIDIRRRLFASVHRAFGGNLEYIICGGAPLGTQYIREFRSWGIEILNGYGTTECAPCAAVNRNHYHKDGTVGVAVPGSTIKIGEDGEVLIKGPIVMQGYYKDGTATSEALSNGWYATGDLGRMDADGFLTLTGRKKNLIILSNGENVSPEELEADFLKYEAVREVLVYEQDRMIAAEIYPDKEYLEEHSAGSTQEYFDKIRMEINHNRPTYKQVAAVSLRDTEFAKNTGKKILRNHSDTGGGICP